MPPAALDELLQRALALPDDTKLLLAEELVAGVGAADSDAAEELIARRRAEFISGADVLIPAENALRQVREELAARRVWHEVLASPRGAGRIPRSDPLLQ